VKLTANSPLFHDEILARQHLERMRWPKGPVCPHCGVEKGATALDGKAHRPGLYQCNECRSQFSVTVGTVFERSKVPISKWLFATWLLCSSKKGVSAHQVHRQIGVTYKTAWFMCHRIREAMAPGAYPPRLGGEGKTIEADETYIRNPEKAKRSRKTRTKGPLANNEMVFALVERDGDVRSFHLSQHDLANVRGYLKANADPKSDLRTDQSGLYRGVGKHYASHETVNHGKREYVRGDIHTNTIEGYFGILKRGIGGVYQHVSAKHLKRYLSEFDFRYNGRKVSDDERTNLALAAIDGRRLTYRRVDA